MPDAPVHPGGVDAQKHLVVLDDGPVDSATRRTSPASLERSWTTAVIVVTCVVTGRAAVAWPSAADRDVRPGVDGHAGLPTARYRVFSVRIGASGLKPLTVSQTPSDSSHMKIGMVAIPDQTDTWA